MNGSARSLNKIFSEKVTANHRLIPENFIRAIDYHGALFRLCRAGIGLKEFRAFIAISRPPRNYEDARNDHP
jgi:hypothetical protein